MSASSYRYRVSRPRRQSFEERDEYLEGKMTSTGFTPRLCQVLELIRRTGSLRGFPWVTVVLGSGALELPSEAGLTDAALGRAVAEALDDEWPEGSEPLRELARAFTESLVQGRIDAREPKDGPESETGVAIEPIAAHLVLVAALLTRFFNRAGAAHPTAFARSESDVASFDPRDHGWDALDVAVVTPVVREMNDLVDELGSYKRGLIAPQVCDAAETLLRDVVAGLDPSDDDAPRRLRIDHLRLVTEVAWHFLVAGTDIYPGWTDLLLSLMLREGGSAIEGRGRLRPRRLDLELLPSVVKILLERATRASWMSLASSPRAASERDRLYEAVAKVLEAQAGALAREGADTHLPPAVASVTSFDLELDMALWRSGIKFSVAIPVHVVPDREADTLEADFCWLLADIDPNPHAPWEQQLELLRVPHNWRLLTPQTVRIPELRARPIVIHLSGCPLFALPGLADKNAERVCTQLAEVGVVVNSDTADMVHAVTVDEYLAMRQSEAELFWTSHDPADAHLHRSRALPETLTANGERNRRFWMALGVPISDPAVRHRIASQISARWIRQGGDVGSQVAGRDGGAAEPPRLSGLPPRPAPAGEPIEDSVPNAADGARPGADERATDIDGVAVNLRIDEDDAHLLYWLGFDVVRDDCRTFIGDLLHYGDHMQVNEPRAPTRTECTLEPNAQ